MRSELNSVAGREGGCEFTPTPVNNVMAPEPTQWGAIRPSVHGFLKPRIYSPALSCRGTRAKVRAAPPGPAKRKPVGAVCGARHGSELLPTHGCVAVAAAAAHALRQSRPLFCFCRSIRMGGCSFSASRSLRQCFPRPKGGTMALAGPGNTDCSLQFQLLLNRFTLFKHGFLDRSGGAGLADGEPRTWQTKPNQTDRVSSTLD